MKILLENGADINLSSENDTTPLHSSILSGNVECIEILYQYEALDTTKNTRFGYNNLELAAEEKFGA
jgi:ankyrin repeat protein